MSPPLTPADAVSPALRQVKRVLLAPFRFRQWVTLAMVALLAGAIGGGGRATARLDPNRIPGASKVGEALKHFDGLAVAAVVVGVVLMLLLGLIFTYLSAKFTLVFVDGVIRGEVHVRHAWRECHDQGESYFFWQIGLTAALLATLAAAAGVPLWRAWRLGHVGIAGAWWFVLLLVFVVLPLCVAAGLTSMVAKDFVVPVMYVERCRFLSAWRRVLPLLRANLKAFALYASLKLALGLAAAIGGFLVALVSIMSVALVFLLPAGIAAAVILAVGWTWSPLSIALCVVCGLVVLGAVMFLYACLYLPAAVFFRAYPLLVLGGIDPGLATLDTAWGAPVPVLQPPPYVVNPPPPPPRPSTPAADWAPRPSAGAEEGSAPADPATTESDMLDLEEFAAPEGG